MIVGWAPKAQEGSAIIPFLASKSLSLLVFGVPGLKRTLCSMAVLITASIAIVSCGHTPPSSHSVSGIKFRAFVSNPLFPSGTINLPVVNIVNAGNNTLSTTGIVSLTGVLAQAGLMAVAPDLKFTLVYSPSGASIAVVDNTTENIATAGTTTVPTIVLPGSTESMFIGSDNATAYVAVPSGQVTGFPPGLVEVINIATGGVIAKIPIASAHYVLPSADGNRTFVFSDNSDSINVITNALVGSNENPVTATISGLDRPVWGVFSSDNSTAYILNCGAECGGTQAGVSVLDVGTGTISKNIPLSAATIALASGGLLYVAGTPPNTACGSGTAAAHCGTLNIVDLGSLTRMNATPILITDGYHNRMQISQNGQLFVGSFSCSNVNSGTEVRGCLTIFNTTNGAVVVPPALGDVTGMQPISGHTTVYVCQSGVFAIYDTTTDQFLIQNPAIDIPGRPIDVKLVDPPN